MGEGHIAHEQFFLFVQYYKICRMLRVVYIRIKVNPFPNITNLQQTTLKMSGQKCEISKNEGLSNEKVEQIVIKEEIARCEIKF